MTGAEAKDAHSFGFASALSLREMLAEAKPVLGGGSEGRAAALRLLAGLMAQSEMQLRLNLEHVPEDALRKRFTELVERVAAQEPEAYALGFGYFMEEKLELGPGVLIPRPDSEILLLCALEYLQKISAQGQTTLHVLEPCTGSACLSKALLAHWRHPSCALNICATELSEDALVYARLNLSKETERGQLRLLQADFWPSERPEHAFDLLFCNPPYVSEEEYAFLDHSVKAYEPPLALLGGADGLDFYRRILAEAPPYLKADAVLVLEHGCRQAEALRTLAERSSDFDWLEMRRDLAGRPRVTVLKKRT